MEVRQIFFLIVKNNEEQYQFLLKNKKNDVLAMSKVYASKTELKKVIREISVGEFNEDNLIVDLT
ncbi:hypothetical protein CLI91_09645 [Lentilactobacillus hilgardii]|mgnify:CR=1 FL=1|nr:hypothetical protein [Lentilactobacillus hilgardii]MBZ2204520.1 hypothetical protein [Lentilactobacillus hilgardii]